MIKSMITGAALLLAVSAQAQQEFVIKGNIKGLEAGTIISLYRSDGQVMSPITQDTVRNESFILKEKTANNEPELLTIMSRSKGFPGTALDVWLAPTTTTTISGADKLIRSWHVNSTVEEQIELNRYADACRELTVQLQLVLLKLTDLSERRRAGNVTEEEVAAMRKEMVVIIRESDSIKSLIAGKEIGIMKQRPFSRIWLNKLQGLSLEFKLNKVFPYKEEVIALYNQLPDAEKASPAGEYITVLLYPPATVKEGDMMPDADLYDLEGKLHHLSDYTGKYMLIDFWSHGCTHCLRALPEIKEISEMEKDRLTVISLSTDTEKGWKEASKVHQLTWANLNDFKGRSGITAKFGVRGMPYFVIISPEGKFLHAWSGYSPDLLKQKIDKWTKANTVSGL